MFLSHIRLAIFGLIFTFCTGILADQRNWNPDGEGCVDPKGYTDCYQAQINQEISCMQFCNSTATPQSIYSDCVQGCFGAELAGNIGCWIQSCWNQVYSCEYQMTAISYFDGLDLVQSGVIPFYPPPPDASAGACSCNLGYVYGNETFINMDNACIDVAGNGDMDATNTCGCCEFGFPVSNILNACPKNDLSILGFPNKLQSIQGLIAKSRDNCSILDTSPTTCATEWNFPWYGPNYYNPLNLPNDEPGTEPLSNNAGNAFTEFGAPAYTLSLFPGFSSVITPAPFKGGAGVETQTLDTSGAVTVTGGAKTGSTGTASGTAASTGKGASGTGSGAAASPTKSGAERMVRFRWRGAGWALFVALVVVVGIL